MKYTAEQIDEFLDSLYEDYKEPCKRVIEKIIEEQKHLSKSDRLVKACAIFYVLAEQEAKTKGEPTPELKDYIQGFIPNISELLDTATVKAHNPKNYVMPNHKIVNAIVKFGGAGYDEIAATKVITKAPEIQTKATLQYDDGNIDLPKNYTQYDRAVLNAICSLHEAGNTHFTAMMVYRVMTGKAREIRVTPQTIAAVTRSIEKQRRAIVKINGTEELKRRKIEGAESLIFDEHILNLRKTQAVINGALVECYSILKTPILYEYCQYTRQIITVPLKLLDTKTVRNTPDVIAFKEYLLRQIELIKNSHRNNNKMLYATIFSECGVNATDKSVAKRYRGYINNLLSEWVAMGHIKAYKEYKQGNKITGVEIKP